MEEQVINFIKGLNPDSLLTYSSVTRFKVINCHLPYIYNDREYCIQWILCDFSYLNKNEIEEALYFNVDEGDDYTQHYRLSIIKSSHNFNLFHELYIELTNNYRIGTLSILNKN